jgi:hypothetical protein
VRSTIKWPILAITAMTLLSLLPQLLFWQARGAEWHGAYVILQPDEVVYSAYLNALIDGRPLRTDPASGQDDHSLAPLPESLFSIQFIIPLIIAWIARACGASASTAFIVLLGVVGLLATLSIFWLLYTLTGNSKLAALGALVVLCFGALAGGQGLIGVLLDPEVKFLGLPFLRRYLPSAAFPLFFVFCTQVWQALTASSSRISTIKAVLAGTTFSILIFCYFYLWTAAAAWIVCVAFLWLLVRRNEWSRSIRIFVMMSMPALLALAVYVWLLTRLPTGSDKMAVLTSTHRPDLFRMPEIVGAFILLLIIVIVRRMKVAVSEPQLIFAVSFALLPFLVFNQQVISGRSIQPFHYEALIANYVVLLGLVMAWCYLRPAIPRRTALLIMCLCVLWAFIEIKLPFQAQYKLHLTTDEMVPVLLRLKEQAKHDGTFEGLSNSGIAPALVFSPHYGISELLPTWAPQGSLLAPGSAAFQNLSEHEQKKRLYTHFYYCNRDASYLRELLNDRSDRFLAWRAKTIMFGVERVSPVVASDFRPIRQDEIEQEIRAYEAFSGSFSFAQAQERPIAYAIKSTNSSLDFSHLDLWYERTAGEQVGSYTLYQLRLRRPQ